MAASHALVLSCKHMRVYDALVLTCKPMRVYDALVLTCKHMGAQDALVRTCKHMGAPYALVLTCKHMGAPMLSCLPVSIWQHKMRSCLPASIWDPHMLSCLLVSIWESLCSRAQEDDVQVFAAPRKYYYSHAKLLVMLSKTLLKWVRKSIPLAVGLIWATFQNSRNDLPFDSPREDDFKNFARL